MCAESEQQVATWAVKIGLLGGWNVPSQCFYFSLHLLRALTIIKSGYHRLPSSVKLSSTLNYAGNVMNQILSSFN